MALPPADATLSLYVEYAIKMDFVSCSRSYLGRVVINEERIHEEWCMTHKLGSLLGEAENHLNINYHMLGLLMRYYRYCTKIIMI